MIFSFNARKILSKEEKNSLIGTRLLEYIELTGRSKSAFAREIGINRVTIQRYLSGERMPDAEVSAKLFMDGCDLNFLLTGHGDMFNSSPVGQARKREVYNKFVSLPYDRPTLQNTPQLQRILGWICLYFGSLAEFCSYTYTDIDVWQKIFRGERMIDEGLLGLLQREGCKLNFIYTGQGKPVENNIMGVFLTYGYTLHECPKDLYNDVLRSITEILDTHDKLNSGVGVRKSELSKIKFGSEFNINEFKELLGA